MLMCYEHHKKTDNEEKYKVPDLQNMKADHEAKFTNIADKINDEITDKSEKDQAIECETLKSLDEVLGWEYAEEDLAEALKDAKWAFAAISSLPKSTRQLLNIIVERLEELPSRKRSWKGYRYSEDVLLFLLSEVTKIEEPKLQRHIELMQGYGLVSFWEQMWDFEARVSVRDFPEAMMSFADLREYCKRTGIPTEEFVVNLRFDLLDKI